MNDVVLLHSKKRLHDSKNDIIIGVEVGKARGICILLRNVGRKSSVWREFSHAKRSGRPDRMRGVRDRKFGNVIPRKGTGTYLNKVLCNP